MIMARTWLKWTPAVVAVLAVTGAAVGVPLAANASVDLPATTPAQVLALIASSKVTALSGTIDQTSDLGLPSLPTSGAGSNSSATSTLELLTGSHTVRIYVDGAKKERLQVMDQLAERDVIRSGSNLWLYNSKGNTVEHATIAGKTHGVPQRKASTLTPIQLAKKLIGQLKPTSKVTLGDNVEVAGRTAYTVVLRPRATGTLLRSVTIAVDSSTGLPLRVRLNARGQSAPAVSVGFSSLTLDKPDASLFAFTPPANSKITELSTHKHHASAKVGTPTQKKAAQKKAAEKKAASKPTEKITGKGWDSVVTLTNVSQLTALTSSPLYGELTSAVSGGRVFHTSLLNVLITTDGRIVAGSVSVARLQAVAASPAS
jgi:outer membrane lipoprotein-sorting protein